MNRGMLEILKAGFEKSAAIPEEGPKWGTTPITDIPGEAHPEGLDENQPVGNDAQNTEHLRANFDQAAAVEADLRKTLSGKFQHFGESSRSSSSQLIKNYPRTNARVLRAMGDTLRHRLQLA